MDVEIVNNRDERSPKTKRNHLGRSVNPLNSIVIKTILCTVIIDLAIWGYFSAQGVSIGEGLEGWQKSFRKLVGLETERIVEPRKIVTNHAPQAKPITVNSAYISSIKREKNNKPIISINTNDEIHDIEIKTPLIGDPNGTIYSWEDENGKIHYSNTGFPNGKIKKLWVRRAGTK